MTICRKLFILSLRLGLMTALFLLVESWANHHYSSRALQRALPDLIPAATLPGAEDELKWWQAVRAAGHEAVAAWARKDEAIAKAKRREIGSRGYIRSSEEKDLIPREELARLNAEIAAATKQFVSVISEGGEKSYRVPVPDNHPIILHKTKPNYTDEARRRKVKGSVVISMMYLADGLVGEVKIVRGLGAGLDEKASEVAHQIIFLPAVKDRGFVPTRSNVEMTFNIY
jgi:TonB family protein